TLNRKTRSCTMAAVVLTLALTLVPSPAAWADQPQFFDFPVNYTAHIQGQCAFDVLEHGEGTVRWMYHPNNGNPIASIYHYDLRGTYTNAVTGTSLSWAEDVVLKGYYQDGSLIVF